MHTIDVYGHPLQVDAYACKVHQIIGLALRSYGILRSISLRKSLLVGDGDTTDISANCLESSDIRFCTSSPLPRVI